MSGGSGWMGHDAYDKDSVTAWSKKPEDRNEHEKRIVQSECDAHNQMLLDTNWVAVYSGRVIIIAWAAFAVALWVIKLSGI